MPGLKPESPRYADSSPGTDRIRPFNYSNSHKFYIDTCHYINNE